MTVSGERGSAEVSRTVRIVLDSTVFCDDFTLSKKAGRQLRTAAAEGRVVVYVSQVVIAEVKRRHFESMRNESRSAVDKMRQFAGGRFGNIVKADIEGLLRKVREDYPGTLDELLKGSGFVVEPYPDVPHEVIVTRDLERRLPFREVSEKSVGYRDALIWTTVLDLAERYPDDEIVFVTDNSSDYTDTKSRQGNKKNSRSPQGEKKESSSEAAAPIDSGPAPYELADELRGEVVERLGNVDRVRLARNLGEVASVYLPTTEVPDAVVGSGEPDVLGLLQTSSDDRAILLEALFQAASLLRRMSFVPEWDPRGADYVPPQYDLELPKWMNEVEVNDITEPLGLAVTSAVETQTANEWMVTTHHLTTLRFEGFGTKADYYLSDDPDVILLDPDWNDHVVHVATDRVVGVSSDVRCRLEGSSIVDAEVVQIISVTLVSTGSPD